MLSAARSEASVRHLLAGKQIGEIRKASSDRRQRGDAVEPAAQMRALAAGRSSAPAGQISSISPHLSLCRHTKSRARKFEIAKAHQDGRCVQDLCAKIILFRFFGNCDFLRTVPRR
jgi:hypothetical protein